jgi:hypothetical protein
MNNEKYFLVKYFDNWADEMDIAGYKLMTETEKKEYFNGFRKTIEEENSYVFFIGTNEGIEYMSFDDFRDTFNVDEISEIEYGVIEDKIGKSMGFFPEY